VKQHPVEWLTCLRVNESDYPWEKKINDKKRLLPAPHQAAGGSDHDDDVEAEAERNVRPRHQASP